jgi:hypothetical protein
MNQKLKTSIIFLISLTYFKVSSEPQRVKFKTLIKDSSTNTSSSENSDYPIEQAKILIAVRIKDHSYSLPTFLATLETLKCPSRKNKCDLW